ncbi:MAG: hypothetical protein HDQ96_05420 [Lachnospiraceae bacterium]|nr:hypothetical protein [Lachnospiraceae bacterium]
MWRDDRRKAAYAMMAILLCICINTACSNVNDENNDEKAENMKQEDTPVQKIEETKNVTAESETEENAVGDMDGWVNEGEEQQYIWGTWTVTGKWFVGTGWSEDNDRVGGIYELLPDSHFYDDKTSEGSEKLKGYYVTIAGENSILKQFDYDMPGTYCLAIEPIPEDYSSGIGVPFGNFLFLVAKNELVVVEGRNLFRLEKAEDYEGEVEGNGFIVLSNGIWDGNWEITGVLKADREDAERRIGEYVEMEKRENYERVLLRSLSKFYLVDTEEKSIRKLVDAMGLEEEFFVAFYEFTDDYEWDQMIIKDEMTVVLVKDGNYFWAKRVLEDENYNLEWIYGI